MSERIFEITIGGQMNDALCAEFDDVEVSIGHGVSRLRVPCRDRSALHGILARIDALQLELLDVRPADTEQH